jgi:hypothetical protein
MSAIAGFEPLTAPALTVRVMWLICACVASVEMLTLALPGAWGLLELPLHPAITVAEQATARARDFLIVKFIGLYSKV